MKLDLNEAFPYSDLDFFDFIKPDFSLTAKYNLISQIPNIKLCLIYLFWNHIFIKTNQNLSRLDIASLRNSDQTLAKLTFFKWNLTLLYIIQQYSAKTKLLPRF